MPNNLNFSDPASKTLTFTVFSNRTGNVNLGYTIPIIKEGIFVLWCIQSFNDSLTQHMDSQLAAEGDTMAFLLAYGQTLNSSQIAQINSYLTNGHHAVMSYQTGQSSFVFATGEQTEFADEIANGDLIVVTDPSANPACYVNITFNNYLTGTLVTSTKQIGTLRLDNAALQNSTSGVYFIPPGQSGVPAAIEEKPLWVDGSGDLRYYEWDANAFFSVTFSTVNQINLYRLDSDEYVFSEDGLAAMMKHMRNNREDAGITRISGFWENTGEGALPTPVVSSPAAISAGMLFGTNGDNLFGYQDIQDRASDPSEWCTLFAHHRHFSLSTDPIADRIKDITDAEALKRVIQSENEWTQGEFDIIYNQMKTLGMRFVSPGDFVQLVQSYPREQDNKLNSIPEIIDNNSDGLPDGYDTIHASVTVDFVNKTMQSSQQGVVLIQTMMECIFKGANTLIVPMSNDGSGNDRIRVRIIQNGTGTQFYNIIHTVNGNGDISVSVDLSSEAATHGNTGMFSVQIYTTQILSVSGITIGQMQFYKT